MFRALTTLSGSVVLATTDGKPFDSGLSTHAPSNTIPTSATSINDLAMLTKDLIEYLDRGPWGGANRGGHTLEIDLDAFGGDLFSVR